MSVIEEKKALRTFIRKKERTLDPAYKAESSEASITKRPHRLTPAAGSLSADLPRLFLFIAF